MKIIIEVDDAVKNEVGKMVSELSSMTFEQALEEKLKCEIDRSVKVLDPEENFVITLKELYDGAAFHANAEDGSLQFLEQAKAKGDAIEIQRMYEDTYTKQKGFKEAYEEMIWKKTGKFASIEQLAKEHGDLSGLW